MSISVRKLGAGQLAELMLDDRTVRGDQGGRRVASP